MSDAEDPCAGGFTPNADVSGIGVRASFYAQAVLLALLSARSSNQSEITDALTTLIVTNLAICVTTLYLGFKPNPELNLYDGLIVCYLLLASWSAIFFTLPQYNRFRKFDPHIKLLAIGQSYIVFATFLAVFQTARDFGSCAAYNQYAKVAIFGSFKVINSGRIVGLVGTTILILGYTLTVFLDYRGKGRKSKKGDHGKAPRGSHTHHRNVSDVPSETEGKGSRAPSTIPALDTVEMSALQRNREHKPAASNANFNLGVDGRVVLHVAIILVVSALAITNTELLRHYNHPKPDDKAWGFGQILPMFLTVLPAKRTFEAFWEFRLSKKKVTERGRRVRLRPKPGGSINDGGGGGSSITVGECQRTPAAGPSPALSGMPEDNGLLHPRWSPFAAMSAAAAGFSAAATTSGARIEEVYDDDEAEDEDNDDDDASISSSPRVASRHAATMV